MAVSGLVLEVGCDEDLAIAGLLHDSLEDQGEKTSVEELTRRFGSRVSEVVLACSHSGYGGDEPTDPTEKWRWRRDHYLAHLANAPTDVLMVSRADKLHNARSIAADLRQLGPALWDRFRVGREGQLWYYSGLSAIFSARLPGGQSELLALTVAELS